MAWVLRAMVLLALVALALFALSARPMPVAAPVSTVTPTLLATVPVVAPTATPRPTSVPEAIISRVTRVTPAPIPTRTPTSADQPTVSIVDFAYMPQELHIKIGQTVGWINDGRELHDATGEDWSSGPIEPTRQFWHTFGFAGRYEFRCTVHLDMYGTIVVS